MFEKGNTLGAKHKLFDEALRRAIKQDDGKKLREAADKLLDAAASGEAWAINALADRLDGKPTQSVDMAVKDHRAEELDEHTLLSIAAAGRDRTPKAKSSPEKPSGLH